ncbi:MAG: cupin domain-containing protein [Anaerolineales bacterium]
MDERLVQVREYDGAGYQPLIDYGAWRVAILNYLEGLHPERIDSVERHTQTDEVFVLLKGEAVLFVGEGEPQVERLEPIVMQAGKIYNVRKNVWHTIVLSRDASVLIVENCDTGQHNSEFSPLPMAQRALILETARREQPTWWK